MKRAMFLASLAFFAASIGAEAQEDVGRQEYMVACAICHGESAKGSGPFAEVLNIDVPGLTRLSERDFARIAPQSAGAFPFLETLMIVDGRTGVRGHGATVMPIWGERFSISAEETAEFYGSELVVRGRLLSLVYYLESIQE